ncbi:MAG: dockerin type I repeat-containing protein [Muribaculaceae bacterium]|nr:dockerin type I repeat-containing protein [Muribaculaceae bacterium]
MYFGAMVEMEPVVTVPGDIDGDGEIGIGDVIGLIDLMLAGEISIEDYPAADVNGDGKIDIGDITALIDQLLAAEP